MAPGKARDDSRASQAAYRGNRGGPDSQENRRDPSATRFQTNLYDVWMEVVFLNASRLGNRGAPLLLRRHTVHRLVGHSGTGFQEDVTTN